MKLKQCSHPFRVASGQVIVNCNKVNTFSGKCIKIDRECGDKGFSFTCSHFSNRSLMENDPTNKLAIVVNHVPSDHIPARHPGAIKSRFIANDLHTGFQGSKIAVHICCCHVQVFVIDKPPAGFPHHGESFRENLIQYLLAEIITLFFKFVKSSIQIFLLLNLNII